jgi:hypothetical protein
MNKRQRSSPAQSDSYGALLKDTVASLEFLLANIGESAPLDLTVESIATHEAVLEKIRLLRDPESLFPDLLETYAQLLAQYCALVLLNAVPAKWEIEKRNASERVGQPYVEVVPGETWQRYYPIHWQIALRRKEGRTSPSLSQLVSQLIESRLQFEGIKAAIVECLKAAPDGALPESDIVGWLEGRGFAPDRRYFAASANRFPKLVALVLRKTAAFTKSPKDARWHLKNDDAT